MLARKYFCPLQWAFCSLMDIVMLSEDWSFFSSSLYCSLPNTATTEFLLTMFFTKQCSRCFLNCPHDAVVFALKPAVLVGRLMSSNARLWTSDKLFSLIVSLLSYWTPAYGVPGWFFYINPTYFMKLIYVILIYVLKHMWDIWGAFVQKVGLDDCLRSLPT